MQNRGTKGFVNQIIKMYKYNLNSDKSLINIRKKQDFTNW